MLGQSHFWLIQKYTRRPHLKAITEMLHVLHTGVSGEHGRRESTSSSLPFNLPNWSQSYVTLNELYWLLLSIIRYSTSLERKNDGNMKVVSFSLLLLITISDWKLIFTIFITSWVISCCLQVQFFSCFHNKEYINSNGCKKD